MCPKCNKPISSVTARPITVNAEPPDSWKGVSYLCPSCGYVLSVAIDPVCLKADMVQEVVEQIRKG